MCSPREPAAPFSGQSDWSAGRGRPKPGPCDSLPGLPSSEVQALSPFLSGSEQPRRFRAEQRLPDPPVPGGGPAATPPTPATLAVAGLPSAFSWTTPESWPSLVGVITQFLPQGLSRSSAGMGRPEWAAESPHWAWPWLGHADQTGDQRPPQSLCGQRLHKPGPGFPVSVGPPPRSVGWDSAVTWWGPTDARGRLSGALSPDPPAHRKGRRV